MAALTSSQSGNFNSSSTWGGTTPADGDTFTISAGHEVVVNSDIRTTNGYGDITVYGHLKFETNGKMRLNGRITVKGYNTAAYNVDGGAWFTKGNSATAGLFSSSGNNMILEVRGNNSDQHGIWVENERFASMKLEADAVRLIKYTDAKINIDDDYISVTDASNYAIGDWINVYRDGNQDYRVLGDESFWVHDVDTTNDRIYYRQFVSPTAKITAVSGTTVTVDNAKVFRKGYKLICDTGSNRKVSEITAIDYRNHKLTMDESFLAANVGETLYQTGAEKPHESGDAVERMATTLTTAIETVDNTNQITVGNASDISVGDSIVIDVNNDSDWSWDYNSQYEVTAKSGNTLTLDDQVRHKHKKGSIVQNLERKFVIKGVDTSTDTRPFLYVEYWTSYNDAGTRHILVKNVRFTQWGGNTSSTYYRGFMIAGYNSEYRDGSTDNRFQHQTRIQGVVIDNANYKTSYTGLTIRHSYGIVVRNNCVYNIGGWNYWTWSSQHNIKMYANYATRSNYCCMYTDGLYEPHCEISYNYLTRSDDYGILFHHNREGVTKARHNILLNHEQRPFYQYYALNGNLYERFLFDGYAANIPYNGVGGGELRFLDCSFRNRWYKDILTGKEGIRYTSQYSAYGTNDGRGSSARTSGKSGFMQSYEHNFEYDLLAQAWTEQWRYKNTESDRDWFSNGTNGAYPMCVDYVYVPANTTVRLSCKLKSPATGSYSYPRLFARSQKGGVAQGRFVTNEANQNTVANSANAVSPFHGFIESVSWDSNSQGKHQTKQLTISAQKKGYFLIYGIEAASSNMREEIFYYEDPEVYFDTKSDITTFGRTSDKKVEKRSGFTRDNKKRIGGTRL